VPPTTDI